MGNLGWYKLLVIMAKKVGGPRILIGIFILAGGIITEAINIVFKMVKDKAAKHEGIEAPTATYSVRENAMDSDGLFLRKGCKFKVWGTDKGAAIIEIIDGEENPHCVSIEWLTSISDYALT